MACPCGAERHVYRRLQSLFTGAYTIGTTPVAYPATLQANGLGHNLAVDIGIAIDHFTLFGTAEIELEVIFFGETDAPMDLVRCGADAAAGIARPGLGHGDFPGGLLPIGQTPRRSVGNEA